jgi:hypothetical protein
MPTPKDAALVVAQSHRQRRKKPNDQNRWPQHPHIRTSDARAKAYVRTAGLASSSSSSRQQPPLDPELDLHSPLVQFGRLLGGTDARVRHTAVLQLHAYLKSRCDIQNERGGLSELDLLKLWKGLWYTLYMADQQPVQQELSVQLVKLIWCVAGTEEEDEYAGQAYLDLYGDTEDDDDSGHVHDEHCGHDEHDDESSQDYDQDNDEESSDGVTMEEVENTLDAKGDDSQEDSDKDDDEQNESFDENISIEQTHDVEMRHCRGAHLASLFVRTLFRTIRREWGHMDKYRVDKFYTLMRLMVREVFRYMAMRHWNIGIVRLFNDALFEEVLSQTPNGLRFHLIDVALDELAKVNANTPMPLTEATFLDCLEPYFGLVQTGAGDHLVQQRVVENILMKFLREYSVVSERALHRKVIGGNNNSTDNRLDENDTSLVMDQVHVGTVAEFIFHVASDGATRDTYRPGLYDLHKTFIRRIKQVGKDVALVEEEEEEDSVDAVQQEEAGVGVTLTKPTGMVMDTKPDQSISRKEKKKKEKRGNKLAMEHANLEKQADQRPAFSGNDDLTKRADSEQVKVDTTSSISSVSNKKRKRNKCKKPNDFVKEAENANSVSEQEITISLKEQAKAKAALMVVDKMSGSAESGLRPGKKQKSVQEMTATSSASFSNSMKRVEFKNTNRARSWQASMQGLRTMDSPVTDLTPEKGILLNKNTKVRVKKTKKAKRASVYF